MELTLRKDFVERIAQLNTYEQTYAALWVISGIEYACREENKEAPQENGSAIQEISKFSSCPTYFYKLGYVQALVDLGRPLKFNNEPYTSQEFRSRGFDALGIKPKDEPREYSPDFVKDIATSAYLEGYLRNLKGGEHKV